MRKISRFSFHREPYWLVVICVAVPLLAILLSIVIPGLWRRWFPWEIEPACHESAPGCPNEWRDYATRPCASRRCVASNRCNNSPWGRRPAYDGSAARQTVAAGRQPREVHAAASRRFARTRLDQEREADEYPLVLNHPLLDQLDSSIRGLVPGKSVEFGGEWTTSSRRAYKSEAQIGTGAGPFVEVVDFRWRGALTSAGPFSGIAFLVTAQGLYWVKAAESSLSLPVHVSFRAYAEYTRGRHVHCEHGGCVPTGSTCTWQRRPRQSLLHGPWHSDHRSCHMPRSNGRSRVFCPASPARRLEGRAKAPLARA